MQETKPKGYRPKLTTNSKRLYAALRAVFGEDDSPVAFVLRHDAGEPEGWYELVHSPDYSCDMVLRALIAHGM